MTLIDETVLKSWPERTWHSQSRPSLHTWPQADQTEEAKKRLTCIGNIVMPDVGFLYSFWGNKKGPKAKYVPGCGSKFMPTATNSDVPHARDSSQGWTKQGFDQCS